MFFFRSSVQAISQSNLLTSSINCAFDKNLLSKNKGGILLAAGVVVNKLGTSSKVHCEHYQSRNLTSSLNPKNFVSMSSLQIRRNLCTYDITKSLTLFSNQRRNVDRDPKTLRFKEPFESPLVVILSWMLAKRSHIKKYVNIYTEFGFDALVVEVTPWQMLWPQKGTQPIAADVLKFLDSNRAHKPIVIHGFSVGGYIFGEVMVHMLNDINRYQPILDKVVAQIWDSAADITEIPIGLPKAMFPKNPTLERALRSYIKYHMRTFHDQATAHYIRSSQVYHGTLVKAPALFFLSKTDPIGAERSNLNVKEDYDRAGIKTTWKCWDNSPHVLHYQKYPEEYMEYLLKHLQDNVLDKLPQRSRAKL